MDNDDLPRPSAPNGGTPQYSAPAPRGQAPPATSASLGVKVFWALVIIGFGAAGYGAMKTYVDQSRIAARLEDEGVEADAAVNSVTEISGRRTATYHELGISYDPPGPKLLEFAEVQDCNGARWEEGIETVRVVYLPDDPDVIRLQRCASSFDTDILPGIIGAVFIALTLFMLWKSRKMWTE